MHAICAPLYLRELLAKQANTRTLRSNTKNLLQIPHTNLKRFGDRALCAYAPRFWNELPDNIKAGDFVISKGVYLTNLWTINICPLTNLYSAFEHYRCKGRYIKYQLLLLLVVVVVVAAAAAAVAVVVVVHVVVVVVAVVVVVVCEVETAVVGAEVNEPASTRYL